jgi:hypothetical protein
LTDTVVVTHVGAVVVVVVVAVVMDAGVVGVAVVVVVVVVGTAVAVVGVAVVLVEEPAEVATDPFAAASTREPADDPPLHNPYAVVAMAKAATTVSKVTMTCLFIYPGLVIASCDGRDHGSTYSGCTACLGTRRSGALRRCLRQ